MIELIKSIFEEKEFKIEKDQIKNQDYYFCYKNTEKKFDFYVLLSTSNYKKKNIEEFNYWSSELMNKIVDNYPIPGIDKNIYMLLIMEAERENAELNKFINNFEEDPYYFKKHVLTYTNQQKEKLKLISQNQSIVSKIESYVSDKDNFSEFKKLSGNEIKMADDLYSLVSKIFIKLPFLLAPIEKEELVNLREKIKNQINSNDLLNLELSLNIDSDSLEPLEILNAIGDV